MMMPSGRLRTYLKTADQRRNEKRQALLGVNDTISLAQCSDEAVSVKYESLRHVTYKRIASFPSLPCRCAIRPITAILIRRHGVRQLTSWLLLGEQIYETDPC